MYDYHKRGERCDDLRVVKTQKGITNALFKLMNENKFNRITVNELCKEAQISRATFYAHFKDKYDLLNYSLSYLMYNVGFKESVFEETKQTVNEYVDNNKNLIRNLLSEANDETVGILREFILSCLNKAITSDVRFDTKYISFSNVFVGGVISYLHWHVKNNFPLNISIVNVHVYEMLKVLLAWYLDSEQDFNRQTKL